MTLVMGSIRPRMKRTRPAPPGSLDTIPAQAPATTKGICACTSYASQRANVPPTLPRSSERILEKLDGRSPLSHGDARHVEPDGPGPRAGRLQECFGDRADLRLFPARDGLEAPAEDALPARLHLAENEHAPTLHHEIELADSAAPVARHDPETATTVDIRGGVLSSRSDRSRRHGRTVDRDTDRIRSSPDGDR